MATTFSPWRFISLSGDKRKDTRRLKVLLDDIRCIQSLFVGVTKNNITQTTIIVGTIGTPEKGRGIFPQDMQHKMPLYSLLTFTIRAHL